MTLSYNKQNVEERKFIPKIWQGLIHKEKGIDGHIITNSYFHSYLGIYKGLFNKKWEELPEGVYQPKIHTIRRDINNRWKSGNDIHFVINNRTKRRFQFTPVIKVKSIQKISIKHTINGIHVNIDNELFYHNSINYGTSAIKGLAKNDGFDSVEEFFDYFNEDFDGKIIHWTDLKY